MYRLALDKRIDGARKHGLLGKWIIALGQFVDEKSYATTLEDIEREVRYLRMRGPEMPGVAYYGLSSWASRDLMDRTDRLNYKYLIAPVVTPIGHCQVAGDTLKAVVRNISRRTTSPRCPTRVGSGTRGRAGQTTPASACRRTPANGGSGSATATRRQSLFRWYP